MSDVFRHVPVLQTVVLDVLLPAAGETVLDVTLGLGGHASAMGARIGPNGLLIALDADSDNLKDASERLQAVGCRLDLRHANFGDLPELSLPPVDVLFADLGLSSPHLDDASRGFSFRTDAPLDMRFDRTRGRPVSQLLDRRSTADVAIWFKEYGELEKAGVLAHAVTGKGIETTGQLRKAVEGVYGYKAPSLLPQVFQALRIAVNNEIGVLQTLLEIGPTLLAPGGRMGVLSYHSLEDRMTKHAFAALTTPEKDPITGKVRKVAPFEALTRKPIVPTESEQHDNPRSRSAKFRAIRRLPTISL
jgi:16S rRNA (cytosine1402-N4)-methyltransferase